MAQIIEFDVEVRTEINDAIASARGRHGNEVITVQSSEDLDFIMESTKALKSVVKKVEEERARICNPILAAKNKAYDFFQPFLTWALEVERANKKAIADFNSKEQKRIAAEAEALRLKAEKERAALMKKALAAAEKGKDDRAEVLLDKASKVVEEKPREIQKVAGSSIRTIRKAVVVDKAALVAAAINNPGLLGCIEVNISALNKYIALDPHVPGVKIEEEASVSIRGNR
jgi:hypothetical protein